ncbi:ribbon-helix-helix domain-containing protein [Coleofasciculus sp.]|uniref:ribbon-helix-helix domain-containing protein n=1 Tax=Coleofasciculus sp. TaxID=3100458 RepID=UPI003A1B4C39
MPQYERPADWLHGEKKLGKQFMITQTASDAIDAIAKKLGISRSEVIERAARCGGMEVAEKFNPETGECET